MVNFYGHMDGKTDGDTGQSDIVEVSKLCENRD